MSKIEVNQISSQCGSTLTVGQSGDTVTLAAGASQSGFGRTGTVDWDTTPKTATFSAVSGNGYFCNTTAGAFTVNLPAGSAGAIVSLADYAGTWQTNTLTVSPNGTEKIGSVNADVSLTTEGQSVTFVYVDSTQGWINTMDSTSNVRGNPFVTATGGTVVTCGNFKTHIFTGPGTFTVTNSGTPAGSDTVDYLVVAGGAGSGCSGGGGGAGGFRVSNSVGCIPAPVMSPLANPTGLSVTAQAYPITVGSGGAGGVNPAPGGSGNNSIFSTITSAGGGGGRGVNGIGTPGGSGGGGKGSSSPNFIPDSYPGGTGNTPPVSPPQGNNGGGGYDGFIATTQGGGGGGAGATGGSGQQSPPSLGGTGGDGSFIADAFVNPTAPSYGTPGPVGSTRYFAGGGGGWSNGPSPSAPAPGGVGGGGTGQSPGGGGLAGTTNTGGGGGGDGPNGNTGGSGIVMIRYKFQ